MKKFIAIVMTLALCLSMTSALAAEGQALVSWYTFGDAYLSTVRAVLGPALEEKGFNVNDQDANNVQQKQTDDVGNAVIMGASVLIVNMVDSSAAGTAETMMITAENAGVPIVFFNRSVGTDEEAEALFAAHPNSAYIGTDQTMAGHMQGKMVGEYVLEHYDEIDLNGDGVISYVMFKGNEANQEAIYRTQFGQEDADAVLTAAGKPALSFYDANNSNKYLVDLNGSWSSVAANDYMTTILSQYNEANGNMVELVIANNDEMALGAINALQGAGYNLNDGGLTIPVFGVDATATAKEAIANGYMIGSISQDNVGMADAVATIAANLAEGKDKFDGLNENYDIMGDWRVNIPYAVYTGE